jgi:hypothetical protein
MTFVPVLAKKITLATVDPNTPMTKETERKTGADLHDHLLPGEGDNRIEIETEKVTSHPSTAATEALVAAAADMASPTLARRAVRLCWRASLST